MRSLTSKPVKKPVIFASIPEELAIGQLWRHSKPAPITRHLDLRLFNLLMQEQVIKHPIWAKKQVAVYTDICKCTKISHWLITFENLGCLGQGGDDDKVCYSVNIFQMTMRFQWHIFSVLCFEMMGHET